MIITVTATPEQAKAIAENFEDIVINGNEITIKIETEIDFWRVFYSGAKYCTDKLPTA